MKLMNSVLCSVALPLAILSAAVSAQEGRGDVVYVPTPQVVVDEMLTMAKIGPKDFLIDLGSGDGRIVITAAKKYGARGFGVDLDRYLLGLAREGAKKEGVADRAQFVEQNLFETDLGKATVISSYLLPTMNLKLRPKILDLPPGTRVVAHDYHMGDWYPDEQKDVVVPEKKVGTPGVSYVYLWIVPAKVAGKWQGKIDMDGKDVPEEITFDQLFQILEGSARVGSDTTLVRGRMRGDQVTFTTVPKGGSAQRQEFTGRVTGDTMQGTVRIGEGASVRQANWSAKLTQRAEVRRPADEKSN